MGGPAHQSLRNSWTHIYHDGTGSYRPTVTGVDRVQAGRYQQDPQRSGNGFRLVPYLQEGVTHSAYPFAEQAARQQVR